jgi:hypothetical protein
LSFIPGDWLGIGWTTGWLAGGLIGGADWASAGALSRQSAMPAPVRSSVCKEVRQTGFDMDGEVNLLTRRGKCHAAME